MACNSPDGSKVAIKLWNKKGPGGSASALRNLHTEVDILQKIQHPNVIKLIEFSEGGRWTKRETLSSIETVEEVCYMVIELLTGGDLSGYV